MIRSSKKSTNRNAYILWTSPVHFKTIEWKLYEEIHFTVTLHNIFSSKISKIRQKIKIESIVKKEQAITPVSYRKALHNFITIKWKL